MDVVWFNNGKVIMCSFPESNQELLQKVLLYPLRTLRDFADWIRDSVDEQVISVTVRTILGSLILSRCHKAELYRTVYKYNVWFSQISGSTPKNRIYVWS